MVIELKLTSYKTSYSLPLVKKATITEPIFFTNSHFGLIGTNHLTGLPNHMSRFKVEKFINIMVGIQT